MFDLSGKVAVVTGGSRGIGRADALALAKAGADVIITDILVESDPALAQAVAASNSILAHVMSEQKVVYTESTSEDIRAMGRRSEAIKMDVTDRDQVKEVFARIVKDYGSIDILVNNASLLDNVGQIDRQADELWDRDVTVNLTGAFNATKAAFPYMKEKGWGRIVFMSSVAGLHGGFGQASYASTKAAVIGLGKSVALEGARHGITANIVAPGIIGTEAFKANSPAMNDRMIARTAMRSAGEPEDVAHAIVYLCSPEAKYVTGHVLTVAGGIDLFTF